MEMHPELCKELVALQLAEALDSPGLLDGRVQYVENTPPLFFVKFQNKHGLWRFLQFDCINYDFQAMAIEPVDPITRQVLVPEKWMLRNGGEFPGHPMKDKRPFLCFPGNRDFYTYEGHRPTITGERWERWRPELRIKDILEFLKVRFATGNWE
jgi:hypothetical protein